MLNLYKFFDTKIKRFIIVLLIIISIICISFLYMKIYNTYHIGIPCVFHEITGLYCPGCGITRAIFSLLKLDFSSAVHNNFLIIIVGPFLLYYWSVVLSRWILFKKSTLILPNWLCYLILIIVIIFGILRNFSFFDFLRPII